MALKHKTHNSAPVGVVQRQSKQTVLTQNDREQLSHPANVLQRPAAALRPADILALQRTVGNRVVQRMLHRTEEDKPIKGHSLSRRETGLPDGLKSGVESLSGISMDDVKVHYNSAEPAKLQARAYTRGTDIFLGPNEEEHLAHEAWHVVQQRQGRVRPTTILAKGLELNDDTALEREADVMGNQALRMTNSVSLVVPYREQNAEPIKHFTTGQPIQRRVENTIEEKMKLWSWLEQHLGAKGAIPKWRRTTIDAFWTLVGEKLQPTIEKVVTAQTALNSFESYMVRPNPDAATTEIDALVTSAPAIEGSPAIRTSAGSPARPTDAATKLAGLKAKLNWIATRKKTLWIRPLKAELKRQRSSLDFDSKWQIYGEGIISEQGKGTKEERWKVNADKVAEDIKKEKSVAPLNTWLDDVIARTKTLNRLWEEGTRTIAGTFGTLPQETVKELFKRYERVTREILTDGVNQTVSGHDWGGVKYLASHDRYARELKIHAMGGDKRVLSERTTPTILNTIRSIH